MFTPLQKYFSAQLLSEAHKKLQLVDIAKNSEKENIPKPVTNKRLCQKVWTRNVKVVKSPKTERQKRDWKIDTKILEAVLQDAAREMNSAGSFNFIKDFTVAEVENIKSESTMLENQESLTNYADILERKFNVQKRAFRKESRLLDSALNIIMNEYDDYKIRQGIQTRTVKRWEKVRRRKTSIRINIAKQALSKQLHDFSDKTTEELVLSNQVTQHLDDAIDDLFKKIEEWEARIDKDLEEVELELQKEQERKTNFEQMKKEVEEKYAEMRKNIEEREAKIQREKELVIMAKASIKIQAWWRGTMVRKKLGPFKPKPKKKSKKNAKKGKK